MWHKRPDWFAVLGVSRLYDEHDLRMSYVIWQEGTAPYLIVELLSPGTEQDDLGRTQRGSDEPPTKWEVYEQILRALLRGLQSPYGCRALLRAQRWRVSSRAAR